jgi:hypothetical protein
MTEKPILFSAPMVRAVLAGTKTQTRRVVKPQPPYECSRIVVEHFHPTVIDRYGDEQPGREVFGATTTDGEWGLRCPYGAPGDRLWVREAWRTEREFDRLPPRDLSPASPVQYEAGPFAEVLDGKLRPGMFMPRWASRITLEVTGVRVEHLQDISEADAIAEGIVPHRKGGWWWEQPPGGIAGSNHFGAKTARDAYSALCESLNGPGSWAANPWLWVVELRRLEHAS